ncbi:HAD family hydrolase [Gracilibacillus caseinilyticus]|uniref:HAD family hydrolase n=1 Tax=Gracilibacillus caseinilyticus TaxID=2932256 RepID=A0ABY4F0B6_9BACI|nr:HAD family hydrolase [Gracilibacillus caseinilyticus]UOQ49349.1 HAD family hydrolase [Gracilibacillus caseinilyticus]
MKKCLIMDLDDTLCDYQQAKHNAKRKIDRYLSNRGINANYFWERYQEIEPFLFDLFTRKRITIVEYRNRRFADALNSPSEELISTLNKIYMGEANQHIELFPDAKHFLEELSDSEFVVAVLTNGPADGQRKKIKALGIESYIQQIYISSEIGFSKPNKEAFQLVLDDLHVEASNTWMIGDSIKYDMEGAKACGIRSILVDRHHRYQGTDWMKISALTDLQSDKRHFLDFCDDGRSND